MPVLLLNNNGGSTGVPSELSFFDKNTKIVYNYTEKNNVSTMPKIKTRIFSELKTSVKAKDQFKTSTLRFLLSDIKNLEIANKGKELTDDEVIQSLNSALKKRKESIAMYEQGQRKELADKEKQEVELIKSFLPKQMTPEEIEKILDKAIDKAGASNPKDFGRVMGSVMQKLKGKADGNLISDILKKKLAG